MNRTRYLLTQSLFLATVLTFASCQDTSFNNFEQPQGEPVVNSTGTNPDGNGDSTGTGTDSGTDTTIKDDKVVTDLLKTCQSEISNKTILTKRVRVFFPRNTECVFNDSGTSDPFELNELGNGPRQDLKIRARYEQDPQEPLTLPVGSKICDMSFNFPQQTMEYDDEIFLTLNNYVLFMSTDYSTNSTYSQYRSNGLAVDSRGLVTYKWLGDNSLYNLDYNHKLAPKYCYGINPGTAGYDQKCNIPETETTGQIKLDIPMESVVRLSAGIGDGSVVSDEKMGLNFQFISTGDNNYGDCEHSDFGFDVELKYFVNQ